jgi:hypothetical protein
MQDKLTLLFIKTFVTMTHVHPIGHKPAYSFLLNRAWNEVWIQTFAVGASCI